MRRASAITAVKPDASGDRPCWMRYHLTLRLGMWWLKRTLLRILAGWPQDGEADEEGRSLPPEAFCRQGLGRRIFWFRVL